MVGSSLIEAGFFRVNSKHFPVNITAAADLHPRENLRELYTFVHLSYFLQLSYIPCNTISPRELLKTSKTRFYKLPDQPRGLAKTIQKLF